MDPTTERGAELNRQLVRDGYCHVPGVAPSDLIERVRAFADGAADGLSDAQKERTRFQGSMIQVQEHEEMLPLIVLPAARGVGRDGLSRRALHVRVHHQQAAAGGSAAVLANASGQRRTVITLWFLPTWPDLPERLRAFYGNRNAREGKPGGWSDAGWRALRGVLAWYDGPVEPREVSRIPDARLT